MDESPRIAVVIPLYNHAETVGETIDSILAQTYQPQEIIVVDDGSTDEPEKKLVRYVDAGQISLIRQENQGVSAARNFGIEHASTDFVAFLDADDLWKPTFLERIVHVVERHPDCSVFASSYVMIDDHGTERAPLQRRFPTDDRDFVFTNYFEAAAVSSPPLWTGAIVVRKIAIETVGGFQEGLPVGEDLQVWAKLFAHFDVAYSNEALSVYRQSSFSWDHYRRAMEARDHVLDALIEIQNDPEVNGDKKRGLRRYQATWLKIRASQFIRNNQRSLAIRAACASVILYPLNLKVIAYIPFALLPEIFRNRITRSAEARMDSTKGRI